MKGFVPKPSEYEFLQKYARMTDPEEKRKLEEAYDKEVDEYFAWKKSLLDDEPDKEG
jgi:hypothetical protein